MLKGTFFHILAKIAFVFSGYLIHFTLGNYLSPASYGVVGVILSILNFDYMFFNDGVKQAVSKTLSEGKYSERDVIQKASLFQMTIVGLLFCCNYFGAQQIATILKDPMLIPYIKELACIIPFTGVFFLFLGIFNGSKHIVTEAKIVGIYPILKLSVIPFSLFVFGDAIVGAIAGYLFAGVCVCLMCLVQFRRKLCPLRNQGERVKWWVFIKTVLSYFTLFSVITLITNLNIFLIKAIVGDNDLVGYYTGTVNFGQAPYFLLTAFYIVLLPVITKYYSQGKQKWAVEVIQDLFAIILTFVIPITVIVSASAEQVLVAFYSAPYAIADTALLLQIFAQTMIGLTAVFCMVVSSTGAKKPILYVSVFMMFSQVILGTVGTYYFGMNGASMAFMVTGLGAMLLSYRFMQQRFNNILNRRIVCLIVSSILLFVVVKVIFYHLIQLHLVALIFVYGILYLGYILVLNTLKVICISEMIQTLKRE